MMPVHRSCARLEGVTGKNAAKIVKLWDTKVVTAVKPSSWNSNTSGSNRRVGNIEQIVADKDAYLTVYAKRR